MLERCGTLESQQTCSCAKLNITIIHSRAAIVTVARARDLVLTPDPFTFLTPSRPPQDRTRQQVLSWSVNVSVTWHTSTTQNRRCP